MRRGARSTFKGKDYQLDDAPLVPKPVQKPRPELMIGGGGEKVMLRIIARWADPWNVWGGPETLARKGKILDGYCAAIGRDPNGILRSAVMIPVLSEDRAEIDRIQQIFMKRMNRDEALAKDTMRAGSVAQMQDKLREAGVGLPFIPTMFLDNDQRKPLAAFVEKGAPALREQR